MQLVTRCVSPNFRSHKTQLHPIESRLTPASGANGGQTYVYDKTFQDRFAEEIFASRGLVWGLVVWAQNPSNVQLVGVGGTFPQPIYSKWFDEFRKVHPSIDLHYLAMGSGLGIQKVTSGETDYGGTDAPLNDKQLAEASVKVLHFPTVVSGVVPIYNLPGVNDLLKFTPQVLAGIYLGRVTKWNDPALFRINPGIKFPVGRIVVIHTANRRGTTYIWSDYLSKVSPEWKAHIGKGMSIAWPVGTAAEGSGNVAKMEGNPEFYRVC